jgi:hypothetical protein
VAFGGAVVSGVVFVLTQEQLAAIQTPVIVDREGVLVGKERPAATLLGSARSTGVLTGSRRPAATVGG